MGLQASGGKGRPAYENTTPASLYYADKIEKAKMQRKIAELEFQAAEKATKVTDELRTCILYISYCIFLKF